ncbi:MAG TPA: T9SS type A sorting domain-containing protein [Chitinophagales bacterium]|nr:T9SS type A sorting domain-containing protein [Chitinophagales bacterium]HMU68524.1 T9SS type A sorting domain-containing protein [Chitinophagales bacterium]HNA56670.1 T9SS type A sorting domain-containing protein [Chitinophagales bacterium]HNE45658.1 T9SS type A sorting domain-containing protein [Chitinophagales bacterium]HNF68019.1 T9SS type A sorting domain-containing protein [Chitinophagales bacterium]
MRKLISFLSCIFLAGIMHAQVTIIDSIYSGGMYRNYRMYIPTAYDGSEAVPLLFNLHGYSSDNFGQALYANFNPIADTAGFITVLPNGTFDAFGLRYWNCFVAPGIGVDDVQFLSDLIDSVAAEYNIDLNRVYSTGMSNGGFMSYTLACELSERIAAIASVAGTIDKDRLSYCNAQHNVPVLHFHGTADPTVPYGDNLAFFSVDSVINYWVAHNHTDATPVFTEVPDIVTTDGSTAEHYVYGNGWTDSRVELYKIIGGEHTWPGTAITFLGITNQDVNACKEIWRFLSQYRLDELSSVDPLTDNDLVQINPNPADQFLVINSKFSINGVEIINMNGQIIKQFNPAGATQVNIPLSELAQGLYLIKISTGDTYITQRFIKQ